MATTTTEPARTNSQRPAYRAGAMLIGIGVGHFVAPKPFDTIVPAELPGDAAVLHLRLGSRRGRRSARCCWCRGRGGPARWPRSRCIVAVFPANVNMVRLWWDKPWPMRVAALARLPLQLPMITKALAIRRNAPRY